MNNPSEELVEKVARAFCALAGRLPPEKWVWRSFTDEARALLSVARPAIIEECAKVAESYSRDNDLFMPTWKKIASAIRALAEKP